MTRSDKYIYIAASLSLNWSIEEQTSLLIFCLKKWKKIRRASPSLLFWMVWRERNKLVVGDGLSTKVLSSFLVGDEVVLDVHPFYLISFVNRSGSTLGGWGWF